ncbi:MAG: 16S rRNA (cytosine(1402)-N(4))-methyltransferase RsmH [Kiritimatiellae bacterium]|nr:16S rRNA (cytosine(1402)-N(4))-methyltransferase RsmH [Kiritimatiellia bacterium]MBR4946581.1 16S rRNA (cytosine(1402)-N(4))-methyltransferase RsmH [Kiritimatiellia bacterium]MBR5587927.1 16S rRNA (cytosine(1402)-N(4))-methyltransferase RsmH [Kiritimatiellia bacterium]
MHIPVLLKETVAALNPQPGCVYIDGTLGQAGHASAVMRLAGPTGKLLGIDRDSEALVRAQQNLLRDGIPGSHTLVHGAHGDIGTIARANGFDQVDAILLDLGVSSDQLDTPERGFSFRQDGPLDMRMRHDAGETAADLVARLSVAEMTTLFRELGEEKRAGAIARAIDRERQKVPFTRTLQLADCVAKAVGTAHTKGRHPATRVFQALRMAVNDEMGDLRKALEAGLELLKPGGVMAILTFESLTDRVVKQTFRAHCGQDVSLQQGGSEWRGQLPKTELIFKKAVAGQPEELEENPRARSAKLRAVRRVEG